MGFVWEPLLQCQHPALLGGQHPAPLRGQRPGQLPQRLWWPWVAAQLSQLSHPQAEQTVCRNCFLSANSLEITNPSPGPGAPRRDIWSSARVHSTGRCERCPKETLPLGCDKAGHPTTPKHPHAYHHMQTMAPCKPWCRASRGMVQDVVRRGQPSPVPSAEAAEISPSSSQLRCQPDRAQIGCVSAQLGRQRPITKYALLIRIYSWVALIFNFFLFYFISKQTCIALSLQHLTQLYKTC